MPKQVCRIRWQKGEPLSLAKYPSTTFLDLPREIRDQIYYGALVSSDPITVWSGRCDWSFTTKDRKHAMVQTITVDPIDPILKQLALGLLSCSRRIAPEAIATFYRFNTFRFAGHDTWQPMYRFLSTMGCCNRAHLRNLMAEVGRPAQLTRDRYGIHDLRPWHWHFDRVHLSCASEKDLEVDVDYLSPAIEACFRILGKDGAALTLRLTLECGFLPGAKVWRDEQIDDAFRWDSLEVPDLVERSRVDFTADRVAVLWEGLGLRDMFQEQQGVLESKGWEIVDAREGEIPRNYRDWSPILTMPFVLRRNYSASGTGNT